ncbi:hypothetical protein ACDL25_11740, partial [Corynebacterium diphtheriae]
MRSAGLSGKGKGGAPITTRKPKGPDTHPDLVGREFKAPGPNRLWVADYYLGAHQDKGSCTRLLSLMCSPEGSSDGRCRIRCALQALPLQALNQAIVCA